MLAVASWETWQGDNMKGFGHTLDMGVRTWEILFPTKKGRWGSMASMAQ